MGGLVLDTKAGVKHGGNGGPILVAGDPKSSRLLKALTYNETDLRMPPTGKLPDEKIAAFEKWIADGAPDPREDAPAGAAPAVSAKKGMDIETGRKWWAFQPVETLPEPKLKNKTFAKQWSKEKIDWFILAKLEQNKLKPSPAADRATLIERASLDLTGLRPSYEEVQAFIADKDPAAYEKLIDRLLASPHYGERWGRYWLDVARFGEDNPTSEATNPPYPFAWRYRDWVIEAVNKDVPYNQFVKLQLAADQIPDTSRSDLRALGYLGAAPIYHTDLRLSKDVIETLFTDGWDERVDAVSRGVLGLTVGCARCHDHKFDPILTKDYYALAGVFASTMAAPRPLADVDPETDKKFMFASVRLFYLSYLANLMNNEPGSKPEDAARQSAQFTQQMNEVRDSMAFLKDTHPEMWDYLNNLAKAPRVKPPMPVPQPPAAGVSGSAAGVVVAGGKNFELPPSVTRQRPPLPANPANPAVNANAQRGRGGRGASDLPFMQSVFDAGIWINGSDPDLTVVDVKPGIARDMNILPHANVAAPGPIVPRQFLTVLSKGDTTFKQGSGRLELADRIFSDGAPLAARVIVNRVWAWHFGKPLVATPSDFGTQGEKPTHPELLDDLAARFIANGWSLKWLHREIMLSATYRQASHPRADAEAADATNTLLWRMNPRRLDVEAYRDNLLEVTRSLDREARRRFPKISTAPITTTAPFTAGQPRPPQHGARALRFPRSHDDRSAARPDHFAAAAALRHEQPVHAAARRRISSRRVETDTDLTAKVRDMYHHVFDRDPTPKELDFALSYLDKGTLPQYAQALLATNEVIFWP